MLDALAQERENNPGATHQGIRRGIVGALIGAYLNDPASAISDLKEKGLVNEANGMLILTEKGYRYIRPLYLRTAHLLKEHSLLIAVLGIIVTLIAIAVTVVTLLR